MQAQSNDKKTKFYAVAKGRKIGVYTNWSECSAQVNGYKGAMFKSFNTVKEAIDFVDSAQDDNFGGDRSGGPRIYHEKRPEMIGAAPSRVVVVSNQRNTAQRTIPATSLKRTQSSIIYSAAEIQAMKTLESLSLYAMYQAHTCNNNNPSATLCEECKKSLKNSISQPLQMHVDPGEREIEPDDETEFIISDDPQVKRWENNPRFDDESESD